MTRHFAILRVHRIRTRSDLDAASRHGRRADAGTHYDPDRTPFNRHWGATETTSPVDWVQAVDACLVRHNAMVRAGAAVAAEFFVGASSAFFDPPEGQGGYFDMEKVERWVALTLEAFYARFGDQVVAARLDLDEGAPHMAICVVPLYSKKIKAGERSVVSYRKVFGGDLAEARQKLIALQDWYARAMTPLGLLRGIPKRETGRLHLSHQQYAVKRQREDQARLQALHATRLQLAKAMQLEKEAKVLLDHHRVREEFLAQKLEKARAILEDADQLQLWLDDMLAFLSGLYPGDDVVRELLERAPGIRRYADAISGDLDELAMRAEDDRAPIP